MESNDLPGRTMLRQKRASAFHESISRVRLPLAMASAFLFCLVMAWRHQLFPAVIALVYLLISAVFLIIPSWRRLAVNRLKLPLLGLDFAVSAYLIYESGGSNSDLYPLLFLPVLAAALSCRYHGILIWASLMAAVLVTASLLAGNIQPLSLLVKTAYLYLAGLFSGYLVQHTYTATEEVSRTLARWNTDLERLNDFSLEVTASATLDEIVQQTLNAVHRGDPGSMAALMLFDENGELRIYHALGWEAETREIYRKNPLRRSSMTLAPILVFKKPLLCSNIQKHPELVRVFQGIPVVAFCAFPLIIEGDVAGALVLTSDNEWRLPAAEVAILLKITNQAGVAIQNILKLKSEEEKADRDGLTGLYNRGYFNDRLDELVFLAQQQMEPISLILLDVDNFKQYNDAFGHPAGDLLLKKLAAVLTATTQANGVAARFGGEEFAVILPDTPNSAALDIAEAIRLQIERMADLALKAAITVSLGVATLPQHAKDRASLVDFCDKSLYQAKHTGKNRVCCGYETKTLLGGRNA